MAKEEKEDESDDDMDDNDDEFDEETLKKVFFYVLGTRIFQLLIQLEKIALIYDSLRIYVFLTVLEGQLNNFIFKVCAENFKVGSMVLKLDGKPITYAHAWMKVQIPTKTEL